LRSLASDDIIVALKTASRLSKEFLYVVAAGEVDERST
jgi:hypothetical protein